jgi:hypothetical protein
MTILGKMVERNSFALTHDNTLDHQRRRRGIDRAVELADALLERLVVTDPQYHGPVGER